MSHVDETAPSETPNVVVSNPNVRKTIGFVLYVISILAGLVALFLLFFPEVGGDVANRALQFVTAAISFISGAFGLGVTTPNVPSK